MSDRVPDRPIRVATTRYTVDGSFYPEDPREEQDTMIDYAIEALPLHSPEALINLERELENPVACHAFIQISIGMWDQRYYRLTHALADRDEAQLMDVILSIESSCKMLGLQQLAALATLMRTRLANHDLNGVQNLLDPLELCGQLSMRALRAAYPA